jgi:hypothetical protein
MLSIAGARKIRNWLKQLVLRTSQLPMSARRQFAASGRRQTLDRFRSKAIVARLQSGRTGFKK